MDSQEKQLRQDLAAAYRLAAMLGWEDTLYTHFSARLPGAGEPRFFSLSLSLSLSLALMFFSLFL